MGNAGGSTMQLAGGGESARARVVDALLLAHLSPAALVITGSLRVLESRGNLAPFGVRATPGQPLRGALAARIRRLKGEEVQMADFGHFRITAIPLPISEHGAERLYCVIFESRKAEHELKVAREQLAILLDESEVTTEELRATLEELRAANGELQDTNDQLSTANRQIERVNGRLEGRSRELERSNDEFGSMLRSLKIPIVVLGLDLSVRRFTTHAARLFGFGQDDIGRPLKVATATLDLKPLEAACLETIERFAPTTVELTHADGRRLPVLIQPYLIRENQLDGVIVTAAAVF